MDNYDLIAGRYDEFEDKAVTLWRLGYPEVLRLLGNINNKKILDFGCGTGTFSRVLQAHGAQVTGVDVSENMINVAKLRGPAGIEYMTLGQDGSGFRGREKFDFVVSNFVLCTIPSREEIIQIVNQTRRSLKRGGKFIFMNSNWDRSNGNEFLSFRLEHCERLVSGMAVTATIRSDPPISLHDYYWSIDDYSQMLGDGGFQIQEISEPMAPAGEAGWEDEISVPPYYVIMAGK